MPSRAYQLLTETPSLVNKRPLYNPGTYILVQKQFLSPPPKKIFLSTSCDTSISTLVMPFLSKLFAILHLFHPFTSHFLFFFPLSSFFCYIFPILIFPLSYSFPQRTSVNIPSPGLFSNIYSRSVVYLYKKSWNMQLLTPNQFSPESSFQGSLSN